MNRQQYRLAYREARKASRFVNRFWNKLKPVANPLSLWDTYAECPGFNVCRLHGDRLQYGINVRVGSRLRHTVTPRLPA